MTTFIVTGASSGIGRATASAMAQRGIEVLAVARRSERLQDLHAEAGAKLRPVIADLATEEGIDRLVATARTYGRIAGIVHAAGSLVQPADYNGLQAETLTHDFRIHVAAPIEINNRMGDLLHEGRLVYVDSYSAASPRLGWSGYSIVKSAAQMAARAAREEVLHARVIRVFPGGVRTELVQAVLDAPQPSPTQQIFGDMDAAGTLIAPDVIGTYIARVALDATNAQLDAREFWDFSDPTSHL